MPSVLRFDTLREIALEKSKVQPKQIDYLTEEAPFLELVPFAPSTHDMWHVAEELQSVDAIGFVAFDAPLPEVKARTKLTKFDMAKMGAEMTVGEDKARQLGGQAKYFASQTKPILKKVGMVTERTLIYNNLRQYAIDNYTSTTKKCVYNAGGTTGGKLYSIVAVRFEEGVCQGLYNEQGFGNGTLFDTAPISGGALYRINDEGVLGYGVRLKSDLGFMMSGDRNIGAIVNIDLGTAQKLPTAAMLDGLLADIRATGSGRTMLITHIRVLNAIEQTFKDSRVQMRPEDKVINRTLKAWGGVPFVITYNMDDSTEAVVPSIS